MADFNETPTESFEGYLIYIQRFLVNNRANKEEYLRLLYVLKNALNETIRRVEN